MSDTSHAGAGPSHRAVEIGTALAMIAFGALVIAGSLHVGIGWGAEGPKSGFFPFYLGVAIIAASAVNVVAAYGQDPRTIFAEWSQLASVLSVVIPTTIYVFAVPWAGIYVSSLILIAVFMVWLGRYRVGMAAAVSIGVTVATYLMFEKWFLVPLPKGPIEDWLGL
ncbi:MAG: tripartite tricarboxylate transporter TctB family protein [Alphaproteobacteria bacterium]